MILYVKFLCSTWIWPNHWGKSFQ